jgi:hypothetical protein
LSSFLRSSSLPLWSIFFSWKKKWYFVLVNLYEGWIDTLGSVQATGDDDSDPKKTTCLTRVVTFTSLMGKSLRGQLATPLSVQGDSSILMLFKFNFCF